MIDRYAPRLTYRDDDPAVRRVARHEAGHAVAAHVLGLALDAATCEPGEDHQGLVRYAPAPTLRGAAAEARDRRRIVAALCGRAACGDPLGAGSDHDTAWKLARGLVADDVAFAAEAGQIVADCWEEARALVEHYHWAISDVAKALALWGSLEGEFLERVIAEAIERGERHPWNRRKTEGVD